MHGNDTSRERLFGNDEDIFKVIITLLLALLIFIKEECHFIPPCIYVTPKNHTYGFFV